MPGGQDLHNVPRPGSRLGSSPGGHGQGVVDVAVARGQGNSTRRQDRGQCGGLSFILKPQWVASLRQMEGRLRRGWDRQAGRQLQSSFQDGAGREHREVSPGRQNAGAAWPTLTGPALWSTAGPSRGGGTLSGASLPGQLPSGGRASCLFHKQPAALGPGRGAGEEGSLQPTASAPGGGRNESADSDPTPGLPACIPSSQAPASQNSLGRTSMPASPTSLPSLLLFLLQERPFLSHFKAQHKGLLLWKPL